MTLKSCCQQLFARLRGWWQREPGVVVVLGALVLVGAFLRGYRLAETMMFQGDQGRDARVVAAIWREHDLAFIGPVTSVGNMYLGPFYYYFMLPWLWLTYPSPLGPTLGVAIVNVIAIGLMYGLGRRWFGRRAALVGSAFFALSSVAIAYSRFSWNPNLSAPLTVIFVYLLARALSERPRWWVGVALVGGLLIQLHYVNLILIALAGLAWLAQIWVHRRDAAFFSQGHFVRDSLAALGVGAATTVPLWLFDWKHGWINVRALGGIFAAESSFADSNLAVSVLTGARGILGRLAHLVTTLSFPLIETKLTGWSGLYTLRVAWGVAFAVALLAVTYQTWRRYRSQPSAAQRDRWLGAALTSATILLAALALAFYRHSVFDHYLLFFVPFLGWGYGLILEAIRPRAARVALSLLVGGVFVYFNFPGVYLRPSGQPYARTWALTRRIAAALPADETFAFVLMDDNGDLWGEHYRYFFESFTDRIVPAERFLEADNLLVIDETRQVDLYDNPSYELVVWRGQPEATHELLRLDGEFAPVHRFYRQASASSVIEEE